MARYAIVIGINHYTPVSKNGLKTLSGAIQDATNVYEWIVAHGGVEEKNAFLITSTQDPLNPIKNTVDSAVIEITRRVVEEENGEAERIYFYFAGHGIGVELDRENNGLCMANWSEYGINAGSLSSKEYLESFLNQGLFKEVVIWMDCCRTSRFFLKPAGAPSLQQLGTVKNPLYMVAFGSQFQNQAYEYSVGSSEQVDKRGVFTAVLLEGLNGGAETAGAINARTLGDYLHLFVPIRAEDNNFSQQPEVIGNVSAINTISF